MKNLKVFLIIPIILTSRNTRLYICVTNCNTQKNEQTDFILHDAFAHRLL